MAGSSSEDPLRSVLVTGASGFIGKALVEQLLAEGFDVGVLTRDPARIAALSWAGRVKPFQGELGDADSLMAGCRGRDLVIHSAGYAHTSAGSGGIHHQVNFQGTANLLQAALAGKVPRFLYLSSSKAASLRPGAYGRAKLAAEALLLEAHEEGRIQVCCLRPSAVYGPGMKGSLAGWIWLIRRGLAPPIPPVDTRIVMIGLRDLCRAVVQTLDTESVWGRTWLLSDGVPYGIKEIESRVRRVLGKRPPSFHLPRTAFALAAAAGEISGKLPHGNIPFGRSGYNTLFFDEYAADPAFGRETGFTARQNFYDELPGLLQEL